MIITGSRETTDIENIAPQFDADSASRNNFNANETGYLLGLFI